MASALVEAHIEAERRLRLAATQATERIWRALPGYNRVNIDQWLSQVVPVVLAAQRLSVHVTDAFIARAMNRAPLGINPDDVVAGLRNGVSAEEVYQRPFVTVWTDLKAGSQWADAVHAGLSRATGSAAMDVQMAMRGTAQAVGQADPRIQRWQRVADGGACDFCKEVDGAILNSDSAMPLHNHCGCSIEPLEEDSPVTPTPSGVAVHEHGELGPVLTDPADRFTSEAEVFG